MGPNIGGDPFRPQRPAWAPVDDLAQFWSQNFPLHREDLLGEDRPAIVSMTPNGTGVQLDAADTLRWLRLHATYQAAATYPAAFTPRAMVELQLQMRQAEREMLIKYQIESRFTFWVAPTGHVYYPDPKTGFPLVSYPEPPDD